MIEQDFLHEGKVGRPPRLLEYKGLRLTVAQWAIARDLEEKTIHKRLERGESAEQALSMDPLKPNQWSATPSVKATPVKPGAVEQIREADIEDLFATYGEPGNICTAKDIGRALWDRGHLIGSAKRRVARSKEAREPS